MKSQHKNERDFGGSHKEDWHKLHDSVDSSKGLTKHQAKKLQRFLQILGQTVKIDPLGPKGRYGVYYRESKIREQIKIHTISPKMLKKWFQAQTGTTSSPIYESTVSNFIAQNPHLILKNVDEQISVWREQELGDSNKAFGKRIDIIFQTPKVVYIVEVKFTYSSMSTLGALEKAVRSVKQYKERVEELAWWSDKELRLLVVWAAGDDVPHYCRSYFKENELSVSS